MPTPTRHRGSQIQRWGVLGRALVIPKFKTECYYLFSIHFGIPSAHTNPWPRSLNTEMGSARKGIGDTKAECYYLFSTQFGITSAHTNLSPRSPNTALGGARKGAGDTKTECYYLFSTHFGITSAHTNPSPTSPNAALGGDSDSPVCWVNKVGTFGVSSARTYWWSCLFGLKGTAGDKGAIGQVGPSAGIRWRSPRGYGEQKFEILLMLLAAYEIPGHLLAMENLLGGWTSSSLDIV